MAGILSKMYRCCCCGEGTTGRQWWNRDEGYGICESCADEWVARDVRAGFTPLEAEENVSRACGERGVHFAVAEE